MKDGFDSEQRPVAVVFLNIHANVNDAYKYVGSDGYIVSSGLCVFSAFSARSNQNILLHPHVQILSLVTPKTEIATAVKPSWRVTSCWIYTCSS